jgi:hypothetical protein
MLWFVNTFTNVECYHDICMLWFVNTFTKVECYHDIWMLWFVNTFTKVTFVNVLTNHNIHVMIAFYFCECINEPQHSYVMIAFYFCECMNEPQHSYVMITFYFCEFKNAIMTYECCGSLIHSQKYRMLSWHMNVVVR